MSMRAQQGNLAALAPRKNMMLNPEIVTHFENLGVHSDVVTELLAAVKRLGEYKVHGGSADYSALYCVTKDIVFCAATGMGGTFWRLRPDDVEIALATGAQRTNLGPEWVEITLFQTNWPKPDLAHWALRAYDFARTGK